MSKIKFFAALWCAKAARLALRALGRNATHFPGKLAFRICPDFLKYVGKPKQIIAVTGTNGKTTVCNLLSDIFEDRGVRLLNNRYGSNVAEGIAASFVEGNNIFGRSKYEMGILEIDERSSKRIYPYIKPDIVVITNLFRDSVMRNAHPEYIASFLESSIPPTSKLILNADDLISCGIAPENERAYFGIGRMDTDVVECENLINDMQICPKCQGKLIYDYRRYHHIGHAHCADCGFASPECDYFATDVDTDKMTMKVTDKTGSHEYRLLSNSIFNIYNMVTVIATLREFGLGHDEIAEGLGKCEILKSRYNEEVEGSVKIVMHMGKDKNALACSRGFDYVSHTPGKKEIILMMNCLGDQKHWSENVCWLYDCDFEFLNNDDIVRIVATGPRAKDYFLRLRIAGVPKERIRCIQQELSAPGELELSGNESVYIFYGTDAIDLGYKVRDEVKRLVREKEGEQDEN